jgi:hypothetical protein
MSTDNFRCDLCNYAAPFDPAKPEEFRGVEGAAGILVLVPPQCSSIHICKACRFQITRWTLANDHEAKRFRFSVNGLEVEMGRDAAAAVKIPVKEG